MSGYAQKDCRYGFVRSGGGGGGALVRARMMFFSLFMKFGGRQNKEGEVGIVGKVENKFPTFNSVAPR